MTVDMGRPVQTSEIREPMRWMEKSTFYRRVHEITLVFMDGIKDMEIEKIGPSFEVTKNSDHCTVGVGIVDRGHVKYACLGARFRRRRLPAEQVPARDVACINDY